MWVLGVLRIHHMFYTSTEMGIQNFKCTDWDVVCAYASYDYLSEWTQPRYHTGLISMVTWEDLQKSNTTLRTKVTALWPSGIPCSWRIVYTLGPISLISTDTRLWPKPFSPASAGPGSLHSAHKCRHTVLLLLCFVYVKWDRAVWVHAQGNR